MRCSWKELLSILPWELRQEVSNTIKDDLLELRLRINAPPELVYPNGSRWLSCTVSSEALQFILNAASRYSPWSAESLSKGYLTVSGGHRIGVCGEVICHDGAVSGIRTIQSLCIRVARDVIGIAPDDKQLIGSILIIGPPGSGKSTLLRDVIRQLAKKRHITVIDERKELFPPDFCCGITVDILTGCPKPVGIDMLLKTMGPDYIAVDEITSTQDCEALIEAANCGVRLLATAHADTLQDLACRKTYQALLNNTVFHTIIVMKRDRTYLTERMTQCSTSG